MIKSCVFSHYLSKYVYQNQISKKMELRPFVLRGQYMEPMWLTHSIRVSKGYN